MASLYQFKITLAGIAPPIWRRVLVGGNKTLAHMHRVIQKVMPWQDCHLHMFEILGVRYGDPRQLEEDPGRSDFDFWPEAKMRLDRLRFGGGDLFSYLYDFGDGWRYRDWIGDDFDPERFDYEAANARLKKLK